MSRARTWKCRKCQVSLPRVKQKCPTCGAKRPNRKTAAQIALAETYEGWVARFGDTCNICGRPASERRRLDRDHCHKTGQARGLLCARCNRALPSWCTPQWLRKAAYYLECAQERADGTREAA